MNNSATLPTLRRRALGFRAVARPVAALVTGILVAALAAGCGGGSDTLLQSRLMGTLDTSFGVDSADDTPAGVVGMSLGDGNDYARVVAVQADGKSIVVGTTKAADGSTNIAVARFTTDGKPDTTFGAGTADGTPDGVVSVSLSDGDDAASAVAIQKADGKIVVAGTTAAIDGSTNIAVARLNTDGSLDTTFGAGTADDTPEGVVGISLGQGNDAASAVAIQKADGKIVVAGTSTAVDKSTNIAVARLNTDGSLDLTFGADNADGTPEGVVGISLGEGDDAANAMAIQSDDKIVVAGTTKAADDSTNIAVVRLKSDGSLDTTFGAGTADDTPEGVVGISLGQGNDAASAVAIQSDGKIVVAGTTTAADKSTNIAVARLKADGVLDTTFGAGTADSTPEGVVGISLGAGNDVANAMVIQSDGKIVVAGTTTAADKSTNIAVARLMADGSLDATFGVDSSDGTPDGVVSISLGAGNDFAKTLALQADGKIMVAGDRIKGTTSDIWLARLIAN